MRRGIGEEGEDMKRSRRGGRGSEEEWGRRERK